MIYNVRKNYNGEKKIEKTFKEKIFDAETLHGQLIKKG